MHSSTVLDFSDDASCFRLGGGVRLGDDVALPLDLPHDDTYPFRQPGEVRLTIKITPEKINELGLEESA